MQGKIVVLTSDVKLRKYGERILFELPQGKMKGIPIRYIDMLIAVGKVSLSSEIINLLLSNNIPLFFMSYYGYPKGFLFPYVISSNTNLRIKQYEAFKNRRIEIARFILYQKFVKIEETFNLNLAEEKKEIQKVETINELMGIEGVASRKMFEKFKEEVKDCGLEFNGRNYRPPKDHVNALLSLAYVFTYFLCLPIVILLGYDPYISYLHTRKGTHASFCSDLIEPVRPTITKLIMEELKRKVFKPEDFKKEGEGVYLRKEKYSKFLNWFESKKSEIIEEIKTSLEKVAEVII